MFTPKVSITIITKHIDPINCSMTNGDLKELLRKVADDSSDMTEETVLRLLKLSHCTSNLSNNKRFDPQPVLKTSPYSVNDEK